ncbi:diphthine methyl ester synthase, putative [Plasmodium berghei]|uniref:diphthine methyl ester synthase n=2 Tax=Plasmodium berghei TaxID=5821 RepID=A0A509AQ08_PLABA|nr:diphthine methyl ester synthase, putative [Plasmodium berghei ANKA]CXI73917.1 diphthine methyl ester synthase, putative [Plasmodium berghei]SCM24615.1 diphthine methyl ester synthase, putative [Plasmodium berghei]SCN27117.1 diphthine methyl ester synthase, putative [Plasmodium berghei]SCO61629.1 diphthine methyl ester synthase, putative [Plasmodium berghei]SCO63540.1 diphthine methyl ester synthase, putative [Plasmodium berghei]|eukprot:XP_034422751.1 diphthine methyl ester synthase, putative [Plasmodium berghei ANKA]
MVLYIIGLGLGDEKDISVKGKELIDQSDVIYLESYTSILFISKDKLEAYYKKKIYEVDRNFAEENCEQILDEAINKKVSFLVVGDPLCATTHHDIILRAKKKNIDVHVIHNASIMSAIGESGMQLYNFGQTVSIPYFEGEYKPTSYYNKIKINLDNNFHTLCLLDIKVKERTIENIMKNKNIYEPPKFMTVNEAIEQLIYCESVHNENVITKNTLAIAIVRIGSNDQQIVSGNLFTLKTQEYNDPLHSLIICAPNLHDIEKEYFDMYSINETSI